MNNEVKKNSIVAHSCCIFLNVLFEQANCLSRKRVSFSATNGQLRKC